MMDAEMCAIGADGAGYQALSLSHPSRSCKVFGHMSLSVCKEAQAT